MGTAYALVLLENLFNLSATFIGSVSQLLKNSDVGNCDGT